MTILQRIVAEGAYERHFSSNCVLQLSLCFRGQCAARFYLLFMFTAVAAFLSGLYLRRLGYGRQSQTACPSVHSVTSGKPRVSGGWGPRAFKSWVEPVVRMQLRLLLPALYACCLH